MEEVALNLVSFCFSWENKVTGGRLLRETELVEKCLQAFSEHQLSEGPEVPNSHDPTSVEEKLTSSEFQYFQAPPLQGWGQNPGYLLGTGFFVESRLQYLPMGF